VEACPSEGNAIIPEFAKPSPEHEIRFTLHDIRVIFHFFPEKSKKVINSYVVRRAVYMYW
jgi:hypothetical protein